MMTEPSSTAAAAVTFQTGGSYGTVIVAALAGFGMDPYMLGTALLGCVVVQTLLPGETVNVRAIVLTTVGSMILASIVAPWIAPGLATMAPAGMGEAHVRATASFLVALFPKPVMLIGHRLLTKLVERFNVA